MLTIRDLEFHYPSATVRADFAMNAGQTIALMGPSGSGKTTILNLIAGFLKPASGDIVFEQKSLLPLKPGERPLTYLFQAHNLFPHLSVWQNLAIGISPSLNISKSQQQQIDQALDWVELSGYQQRQPNQLSGGQQQRVALARCLLRQRPILLLDEPFSALDQTLRHEMIALIKRLQQEQNLMIILSTHQPDDAAMLLARTVQL